MIKEINMSEKYRETAILCFGNTYYTDYDHQNALVTALEDENIEIDSEDVNACKEIEKEYGMCAIDYFVDDFYTNRSENEYLLIQTV
jgi:hypothetical protein